MDKVVAVVFNDEKQAYEGLRAFRELHRDGSITLYSDAVVAKDASGKLSVREGGEGPEGTFFGLLTGSLIGILGGPTGLAVGASTGTLIGAAFDLTRAGILVGMLYGGIGVYLLARPVAGLASLTLALAIYLVTEGVLEFVLSFQLRPLPGSGWLLFDGIVTLVLAAMIGSAWPISSVWAVGTLVGVSMFFSGITRLMVSVAVRQVVA